MFFRDWLISFCAISRRRAIARQSKRRHHGRAQFLTRCPAVVEALEDRTLLSTFTVTNTEDSGAGSLRQAIADSNILAGADEIVFNLQGDGPPIITLTSGQLTTGDSLTINGPGADQLTIIGSPNRRVFNLQGGTSKVVVLDGMTITGGNTTGNGGGILNFVMLTVKNSTISGNKALSTTSGGGAGIFNNANSLLTLINSTVSGNTAGTFGGGIFFSSGALTIINSTISGNRAGTSGGGIHNFGALTATNSTITGNRADADGNSTGVGGGIALASSGNATLNNTIVAGNLVGDETGSTPSDITKERGTVSGSNNLIGDASTAGGLTNGTDNNIVGANPQLGPLQNNGGPTETHELLAGSPAIDAGNNTAAEELELEFDQRGPGFSRSVDGDLNGTATVDIGSYEVGGVVTNDPPTAKDDDFTTNEDVSLSGNVLADNDHGADSDPDGDTLTVNTTPVSGPSNGTVMLNADGSGSFTYEPNVDFSGVDSFIYEVSDGNGGTATATVTITVLSAEQQTANLIAAIGQLVDVGSLNRGQGNSLIKKLNPNGNLRARINRLGAFINHVNSLVNEGVLTEDEGQSMIKKAEDLRTSLSISAEPLNTVQSGVDLVFAESARLSDELLTAKGRSRKSK